MKLEITKKSLPPIILCVIIIAFLGYYAGKQYAVYQNNQDIEKANN